MQGKMIAVAAQAGLAFLAWWMTRSDDERRMIQARTWREVEKLAMKFAMRASDLATVAERRYKETVSV